MAVVAVAASGMLVYHHFGGRLPGCGPTAGCESLQHGRWGFVPGTTWPIAFVGLTYFVSLAAGLALTVRSGFGRNPLRFVVLLGAVGSLGFIGLMIHLKTFCLYCAITHAANLLMTVMVWWSVWREVGKSENGADAGQGVAMMRSNPVRALGAFGVVAALSSAALGVAKSSRDAAAAREAERQREASAQQIIEQSRVAEQQPVDRWGTAGFTGRYRMGPEQAAIRVVVLTDYQCPDCARLEGEIMGVLKSRTDMSLSVKHFPMCVDCNKYAGRTIHANACWAARAAEAAGILGGDDAFFKMHEWLFANKGTFITAEDLGKGIAVTGLDPGAFNGVLQSPATLKNVQADIEDGMALGLFSTPMIFINGVEFKGWHAPGAFKRTVDQVAATTPPAKTAAADRPPLAAQRFVNDWKESPKLTMPTDKTAWSAGLKPGESASGGALVEITVWGDYQEESTIKLDAQIMDAIKGRTNVRYTFRHYPVDPSCNTLLPAGVPKDSIHPLACIAAKAAEAAGVLGGNEGYWKMHAWLMQNWKTLGDDSLLKAAKGFGWEAETFKATMASPNVIGAILEDCSGAKSVGLTRVPFVFVNGRVVPRVLREGDNVLKRIVEEAGAQP